MPTGQQISYSATLPQKRVVTDRIIMTDPMDIVAISALGLDNASKFMFVNEPGKMYEWLQDTRSPRADAVNDTGLTSVTTVTQFSVDNGAYFQAGDLIMIGTEYMWVSAVSSDQLTVTRNWGGTASTHANDAVVSIVGRQRLEGATAGDGHWTEPTTGYNYSAILQKSVEVSRSDQLLKRYGIPDLVNWQIDKIMDENLLLLNSMFYHGQRKAGAATPTARGFGGLLQMISTNATAASSAALTRKMIEDAVQTCWAAGGNPDLILCGGWAKRKIASFYEGQVRTERSESMGGIEIDRILTPLGVTLNVAVDRNCPTDSLFIIDRNFCGGLTIDPFFYEDLAKTKDTAAFGQVVGEYGFVLANEQAHAKITGFSTSA